MTIIPKLFLTVILGLLGGFYCTVSIAQDRSRNSNILFYQLNTANGLTDNYISSMVVDKSGNLWVATGEGLNMFNGKTVVKYFNQYYPQLQNDDILQVVCDDNNRIWVLTDLGNVTVIDEHRKFHRLGLYNNKEFVPTRWILQTAAHDIILFTHKDHYVLNRGTEFIRQDSITLDQFASYQVKGMDSLYRKGFNQLLAFDQHNYLFSTDDAFYKINYKDKVVEKKYDLPGRTLLCNWSDHELLVYNSKALRAELIDLNNLGISYPFQEVKNQYGKSVIAPFTRGKKISENKLLLTTRKGGLYIYDIVTKQMLNYKHNAADPTTIINSSPSTITVGPDGWIFLGATPNGVSYYNSKAVIGQQTVFQDKLGNSYDGYIITIATLDNDTYYISTSENLLKWTRSTNTTEFVDYGSAHGSSLVNREEVYHVAFDSLQHLWIATFHHGIFVIDKNKKLVKHLEHDTTKLNSIPVKPVQHFQMGMDGYMWISTGAGMCKVHPVTFEINSLNYPDFSSLKDQYIYRTWFSDPDNIWICTRYMGLMRYTFSTRQWKVYNKSNGLLSNDVLTVKFDRFKNIYVGTAKGMTIYFTNGSLKTFTVKEGLLNKRVEALLLDKNNRMWIGNDVGLACFNIKDTSLKVFDERYGLSIQGFRVNSYHQNSDDELIWGTEKGLQYFYPDDLLQQKIKLKTTINRVEARSVVTDLTQNAVFDLAASDNYVTFYFTSIDYSAHLRTFYEYQLEGLDKEWIKVVDQNFVRYSSLPAGKYTFRVRASNDGKLWENAVNTVVLKVAKPLWQQLWFKIFGIIFGLLLIWIVINYFRRKQMAQREELETEAVINFFASQINSHQKTDDILWDVVKNCISKLNFKDCVIYLVDAEKGTLVQKAAYGEKNKNENIIHHPIDIPIGKGIVGTVARTGKAEIIGNTEIDSRYIVDDEKRYSEIAVPIIMDREVIGVIDSEHPRKNYFTQKHLTILSTIAVLCANQIQRAKAEEEKQTAKMEVLLNKQKAAESRLQSLRLQMNPHFLFNALNSIQQMILANEEMIATRYLSRFSKLLRTILVHSDKEMVSLREEIEILTLYVELESVRFKDQFSYRIICDKNIDTDEIKIPTLLVQPFVENAIWHGLMHKVDTKELLIEFTEEGNYIKCIVEDNGIGREKSTELKISTGQGSKHKSKGIEVSVERLKNMRNAAGEAGEIQIIDLKDQAGNPRGTRIELFFPV